MTFQLTIKCDNAAFEDGNLYAEVARILREAAEGVEGNFKSLPMRDSNGNKVGEWQFSEEDHK